MPESPEVQSLVESVGARIVGRDIRALEVVDFPCYKTRGVSPSVLAWCRIGAVERHGKYVDVVAGAVHLVISFGRGGWLAWGTDVAGTDDIGTRADSIDGAGSAPSGALRTDADTATDAASSSDAAPVIARLTLTDGTWLELVDRGRFRSVGLWIADAASDVPGIAKLGPDPVDATFTRESFDRVIVGRRKQLKAVLQEQSSFAGIGNAYSDEILFAAGLSPVVHASELTQSQRDRLVDAMRAVLAEAISARRGIPFERLKETKAAAMLVHGRGGEPCVRGNGIVQDFVFAGASAQYCAACQTGGVPL